MDDAQMKALREPFPAEVVGKLPRVTCKACSANKTERHCDKHQLIRCAECGNWITEKHIHLDYVGHAATTDRLLQVDPTWTWWPMALDESGAPKFDAKGGLWIMLKVCDVQRPGYGDGDSPKEVIGDAIRNAAMRFGVALDLWSKEPLAVEDGASELASPPLEDRKRQTTTAKRWRPNPSQQKVLDTAKDANVDDDLRHRLGLMLTGKTSVKEMTAAECDGMVVALAYMDVNRAEGLRKLEAWEAKQ